MMRWRYLFVLGALLMVLASLFACSCDDDDDSGGGGGDDDADDDTDDDVDDDAGDDADDDDDVVESLEEFTERVIQELDTEGETGAWMAYMLAEPLQEDDQITPASGDSTYTANGEFWFGFLDRDPYAQYEHPVSFVFIDGDTGEMVVEEQGWWPELNGTSLFVADVDLAKVYAGMAADGISGEAGQERNAKADAPTADYGDAPDDTPAYEYGSVIGRFPTLFATTNSVEGRPGGHTLTVGEEKIGPEVSAESDADDPADPDGVPNLVDQDKDDRVFMSLRPDTQNTKVTVRFLVQVTVAADAPDMDRHLNILVDHNRDGEWKNNDRGEEWLVENFVVRVEPGTSKWVWTDPTDMPLNANNKFGFESWVRVALTRATVDGAPFGDDGWDGSGAFDHGEIEDHYFNFLPWYGPGYGADEDATMALGPDEPPLELPGERAAPTDGECNYFCDPEDIQIPVDCKALVINLGDSAGNSWMQRNARRAWGSFEIMLGDGSTVLLDRPTKAQAMQAVTDFMADVKCLDELYLYFTGHGESNRGSIRVQNGTDWFRVSEVTAKITAQPHCPSPMNYFSLECRQPGYCNINAIVQSCYSGFWLEGDNSFWQFGMNVLTSASKDKTSYGRSDGNGSYVSNAFWEGYKDSKADAEPNGNGDGVVTPEEAMKYARDEYGGRSSGATTSINADCECQCAMGAWTWTDLLTDLIFWLNKADPAYVGHLDIALYGIDQTPSGFDAVIQTAEDLPGFGDTGFHEYYTVLDANPDWPNYGGNSPTSGGDTAYIAQFLNGVWTMFLFQFLPGPGWTMASTTATVDVNGNELVMHINGAEAGVDLGEEIGVHMTTWYRQDGTLDVGDDTDIKTFTLSE